MWGKTPKGETRLAASDVYSLTADNVAANSSTDKAQVLQRLANLCDVSPHFENLVYQRMVTVLTEADLTINFSPKAVFRVTPIIPIAALNPPSARFYRQHTPADSYKNSFQLGNRDRVYMNGRDQAEREMFKYDNIGSLSNDPAVVNRISTNSVYNDGANRSFAPRIRPKYGALNILGRPNGGAGRSSYGESHLVLKEHIKHRCTFTENDSFALNSGDRSSHLATLLNPDRVLLNMRDNTFIALYKRANYMELTARELANHPYVEAQIHTEIFFSRDVKKIRISNQEINAGNPGEVKACKQLIEGFVHKNGIWLEYF